MDILVPIIFMICASSVIIVVLRLKHRARLATLEVLRQALVSRDDLDAQSLKAIASPSSGPMADLRRAGLLIATALAGVAFSFFLPDKARAVIVGVFVFPTLWGLTLLCFHIFGLRDPET